jgi:threonyl-tRNA synthetase
MFPPMSAGSDQIVLRPSLCPHHALIYRSRQRSHRELPLRIAELGGQFREEASGTLGGLTRVRAMQLNDAHVFCPPADIATEVAAILDMIGHAYDALGISAHHYRLSLRGGTGKYAGDAEMWDRGEQALAEVLGRRGLAYESAADEGAFYGPKIDVQIVDPAGRESTLSTVQLDFYQPRQFGLSYVAADQSLQRPVMIHRSIVGSLERLVAHLTEIHAGAFPTWMAPVQVVVLPVACPQLPAAESLLRRLINAGLRAEISGPDRGTLGARIRSHRLVPYQAIVGARETDSDTVSLRLRTGLALDPVPAQAAADRILAEARPGQQSQGH